MPMPWRHICFWILIVYSLFYPVVFFPFLWYIIFPMFIEGDSIDPQVFYSIAWKVYLGCSCGLVLLSFLTGFLRGFPFRISSESEELKSDPKFNILDFYHQSHNEILLDGSDTIWAIPLREELPSVIYERVDIQPDLDLLRKTFNQTLVNDSLDSSSTVPLYQQRDSILLNPMPDRYKASRRSSFDNHYTKPHVKVSQSKSCSHNNETPRYATIKRLSVSSFASPVFRNALNDFEKTNSSETRIIREAPPLPMQRVSPVEDASIPMKAEENEEPSPLLRTKKASPYASFRISSLANTVQNTFRRSIKNDNQGATLLAPEFVYRSLSETTSNTVLGYDNPNIRNCYSDHNLSCDFSILEQDS
ncbi:hypothetical protein QYM36_003905, partial [Artemia franciscana]